jgi:hypothetical protein
LFLKNKGGGGGNSGNRGGRGPSLLDILVLSSLEVAEEVVLAADLLVEDLAAEADLVDLRRLWRWLEWRLVTDSVNMKKKAANCSFFFFFSNVIITCENTSFIMLYTGKFLLLSTSRVPFLIILKAKYSIRLRFYQNDVAVLSKIILNNRLTPLSTYLKY